MNIKIGISGILIKDHQVLLGRRPISDSAGGLWVTPGGGIELWEDMNDALVREFKEETGLDIFVEHPGMTVSEYWVKPHNHNIMIFKFVNMKSVSELPTQSSELDKLGWFYADDIIKMIKNREVTFMTADALRKVQFI